MIQFIKNLTDSNKELASAIKAQTGQEKLTTVRMREISEKLDMFSNLNDKFLQTLTKQLEQNMGNQEGLTGKLDEFLRALTSFFAFQKKQELRKQEDEENSKPTPHDLRY